MPAAVYRCSRRSARHGRISSPMYSITNASFSMASSANRPQECTPAAAAAASRCLGARKAAPLSRKQARRRLLARAWL
jgi:hypothetical protein